MPSGSRNGSRVDNRRVHRGEKSLRGTACGVAAAGFLLLAAFTPREWAQNLPSRLEAIEVVPGLSRSPISGTSLLRSFFLVDALLLVGWAFFSRPRRDADDSAERPEGTALPQVATGMPVDVHLLVVISFAALALRLYRVGSDLWVDEIVNLQIFRDVPALHVIASYRIVSNHLMNTLLVKAMVGLFGEVEWAVRLPAILFGALTVPALWAAARRALGPHGSLLAALLLAGSYHHVFYSQNARGYSAHLFFAIVATGLLSWALRCGARGIWAWYITAMLGCLASMLHGFFVLAGHVLAVGIHLARRRARGTVSGRAGAAIRSLFLVSYLGLHLYALVLPDAIVSVAAEYGSPGMGYRLVSLEHVEEWARGLAAGAGPGGLLAVGLVLAAGAAGLLLCHRRDPVLVGGLALPLVLTAAFVFVGALNVTPRTFLLGLPLALMGAVSSLLWVVERAAGLFSNADRVRSGLGLVVGLATAGASWATLRPYYRHPKQDFRGAIRYVEQVRRPQDLTLAIYLTKAGFRHYGPSLGLVEGRDFAVVQSVEEIERVRSERPGASLLAVTTLARATRLDTPDLQGYIERHFRPVRRFPGTLGDGDVTVWVEATR